MDSKRSISVPPIPLAMVVCDQAYRDSMSQKTSLLGLFSVIFAPEVPAKHPYLTVYLSLTDAKDLVRIKVHIVDINEVRSPIATVEMKLEIENPRQVFETFLILRDLEFPEFGEYRVQTFAGNDFLVERSITVIESNRIEKE